LISLAYYLAFLAANGLRLNRNPGKPVFNFFTGNFDRSIHPFFLIGHLPERLAVHRTE
jgi:hypothetical protein